MLYPELRLLLFFLNVYNWTCNGIFTIISSLLFYWWNIYFLCYKAETCCTPKWQKMYLYIHLPMPTKPRVFITTVTEGTFRSWFTAPVLVLKCHLATTWNGAQITDWFLRELCWMWYLASVSDLLSLPLQYSLCMSLRKYIFHPPFA